MKGDITKKIEIAALVFFVVLFAVILIFIFFLRFSSPAKNTPAAFLPTPTLVMITKTPQLTQRPFPASLDINYSNLNQIVPGKSTFRDVEKINGLPSSSSTAGNKTYLSYPTPFKDLFNQVLIINNVVIYAKESVFSDYRGDYNSFIQSFGQPDFIIYNNSSPLDFPWYVFLKHGVAAQSTSNDITGIIYFVPQNKVDFIKNVAVDLGLSENVPVGQPEFTGP